jgi:hypothetical protein
LKGLLWLIWGLCVWFIPTIVFQIGLTSGNPDITMEEAPSLIPQEFVIALFVIALPIILKGVINIRKERKAEKQESKKDKKKSKKKK